MPLDPEALAADVVQIIKAALAPVVTSLSSLEARLTAIPAPDATLPARLDALEAKEQGLDGKDGEIGPQGVEGPPGPAARDGRDGQPGVPGPPGDKGQDGANGVNGAPGRDGTLENLKAMYDGERTLTLCFKDGTPIDGGVIRFPIPLHQGVYQDGKAYEQGDSVTWGGSTWIAKEATRTKPGDVIGAAHWVLSVKKGRDGKDGKDAPSLPVVKVR